MSSPAPLTPSHPPFHLVPEPVDRPLPGWGIAMSSGVAVLAAGSSAVGLAAERLYRDDAFVTAGWLGNDLVTLFLASPVLLAATVWATHGSLRGRLLWLGSLAYMVYNYAFYLFGAEMNGLFLAYVGIVGLSGYALLAGLITLDVPAAHAAVQPAPRWVSAFMALVGTMLGLVWVGTALLAAARGDGSHVMGPPEHPTSLIAALDLLLVVPAMAVGAAWTAAERPWGTVVGAITTVQAALYMAALGAATVTAANAGLADGVMAGLWATIGLGSFAAAVAMLRPRG